MSTVAGFDFQGSVLPRRLEREDCGSPRAMTEEELAKATAEVEATAAALKQAQEKLTRAERAREKANQPGGETSLASAEKLVTGFTAEVKARQQAYEEAEAAATAGTKQGPDQAAAAAAAEEWLQEAVDAQADFGRIKVLFHVLVNNKPIAPGEEILVYKPPKKETKRKEPAAISVGALVSPKDKAARR